MIDATAIIMTKNEEKNIVDCLKSMDGFAKRCVVIDCGSTDRTVELAKENGADVYFHEFEYYAKQFNWALDNVDVKTKWVYRIYRNGDMDSLYGRVVTLIEQPELREQMGKEAYRTLAELWNADVAAERFLALAQTLLDSKSPNLFEEGPCSRARILKNWWYKSK